MAAPMRYFVNENLLQICRKCHSRNTFPSASMTSRLWSMTSQSWSVTSRLLHRHSGLPSTNPALKQHDSDHSLIDREELSQRVVSEVNSQVSSQSHGRLFAVISIGGKQKKVTQDDLIMVGDIFQPTVGDRIRLEKVLLVGAKDFTVIGRPILSRDQVTVEAVVVEKTLDVPKPVSYYRPRKNFFRFKLAQPVLTVLRINKIQFNGVRD